MNRPVHFDIQADDPERAKKFYEEVFGWKINKWENPEIDYWLIETGPKGEVGINGGLGKRQIPISGESVIAYVCTMEVEDLDEMVQKVKNAGGTIDDPRMEVEKVGWMAMCKDTENNIFSMMQMMPGTMENS